MEVHISFDDIDTRKKSGKENVLQPLEICLNIARKTLTRYLFQKTTCPWMGHIIHLTRDQFAIKQCNPDKRTKYGLLFKSLNCAWYYVTGSYNYIPSLVNNLEKHNDFSGRNISMD